MRSSQSLKQTAAEFKMPRSFFRRSRAGSSFRHPEEESLFAQPELAGVAQRHRFRDAQPQAVERLVVLEAPLPLGVAVGPCSPGLPSDLLRPGGGAPRPGTV